MDPSFFKRMLLKAAENHPGLSQEELVKRLRLKNRFDANVVFVSAVREGFLVEVGGCFYAPSASGARAVLQNI